jgi:DNA-binding NarL/FixJ family response regulator
MRAFFSGDPHTARTLNAQGIAIADRHGDLDLRLLAGNGHAQARLSTGELAEALAELDEMMVLATTAEVNPQAAGLVCCAVINACTECMDVHRTIEWTQALTRWCDRQPGLVPYRGQCTVHQAEMHQLRGRWDGALADIRRVLDRVDDHPADNSVGMAHYRHGELLRVSGSYGPAEDSYREALRHGHDPQPGLALLRLAQGRTDAALTAIRRALDEDHYRKSARTQLLAAGVETALAAGDAEFARSCAARFQEVATELDSPLLAAFDAVARGSIALAEDRPQRALAALREALAHWVQIDAPYEAARCRVLVAQAHRALGDEETADLELELARSTFAKLCAPTEAVRLAAAHIAPVAQHRTAAPDGLTPREVEVLRLVATGASNRDIATTLFLSEKTVARHVANIFTKIDVSSRSAATAYAFAQRLA